MGKFLDLTGQKFGMLTVINRDFNKKKTYWNCKCDCGSEKSIRIDSLRNGKARSCGKCSNNTFIIKGTLVYGHTSNKEEFIFDIDFYDVVKKYSWYMSDNGYILTTTNRKKLYLHRFLLKPKNNMVVDHINGNKMDNRICNLRQCSHTKNLQNSKVSNDNSSGFKGVYWHKKAKKWIARIQYNKNSIHLGSFGSKSDAVKARLKAEILYFGEFRYKGNDKNILKLIKDE